ncbi:hypothetical protein LCGC14_0765180 [marine sediment metagenome]|uniref:Uncharacterized protein n=1 Tax=marine sediment metagenome TaxID=412755 RepID=A0A0F9Q077_9ZZZZ
MLILNGKTPQYITSLLLPNSKAPTGRRAWGIDLETVWLPFLTATNTMGDTAIPYDALGCPIRLAYDKDGSVKFSKSGRPVTRIAKPIADSVNTIRQNFVAGIQQYTEDVVKLKQEEFAKQVELMQTAGKPIIAHDKTELDKAIQLQLDEAMRVAEEEHATTVPEEEEHATTVPESELVSVS